MPFTKEGGRVYEVVEKEDKTNKFFVGHEWRLYLSISSGSLQNDGENTVTATVSVVDGLEVARGTDPSEASVLDDDQTATVEIDGSPTEVSVTDGSGTKEIKTERTAGSTITVRAVGLDNSATDISERKTIEVTEA